MKSFFTTKLSWSSINRFPHTSFVWQGLDDSSITAHVVLIHDYNEWVDVRRLREDMLHHQQSAVHPEMLIPTGYGDGGGGPTEAMIERARRVANLAGMPQVEWGNIEPFFERMRGVEAELPVVKGELLLELHRGVFTTHGELKYQFRRLERALQTLEAAHVVRGLGPIDLHYWKRASFSHFHDYIPGSSIWEVYAEAIPELAQLADKAYAESQAALNEPGASSPAWFNPLPLPRTWIDGEACYELAPLSGAPVTSLKVLAAGAPEASPTGIASDRVEARFSATGSIASLHVDGRKVEITTHKLVAYPDHPAAFDAWDVDRGNIVLGSEARLVGQPEIRIESLEASVSFSYEIADSSAITVIYSVRAGEPALRIRYAVDWKDPGYWLKAVFVSQYNGREARYGAPFGSVLRGQWPGYPREEALWEVPASRWMVVADDAQTEGLAILTESKYGFTTREGMVGVSLLRSALVTEASFHPDIRPTPDRPEYSDLGRQTIDVALTRYSPDLPVHEQPAALADVLFTPCIAYQGGAVSAGFQGCEGLSSAVPAWAEPLGKGWVLRLHETLGRRGSQALALADGVKGCEADMYGKPTGAAKSGEWTFTPYQVRSVLIAD